MSRKSRPPESGKKSKGKKGRKGKKESSVVVEEIIEEGGLPFGLVVLIALMMSLPSLMAFFDGTLDFRPTIVRLLAALLVSWLLVALVHSVFQSFGKPAVEEKITRVEETTQFDGYGGPPGGGYGQEPYGSDRAAS